MATTVSSMPVSSMPVSSMPVSSMPVSSMPVSSMPVSSRPPQTGFSILGRDSFYLSTSSSSSGFSEEFATALRRSCLNINILEPCVNRAAALLEELKDLVHHGQLRNLELKRHLREIPSSAEKLVKVRSGESLILTEESSQELKVEGFSTGTPTAKASLDIQVF